MIEIDQSPIGRTPRSNPATYTGLFAPIRELFAAVPESRARGYEAGRFSFNVKGGRCEACQGDGVIKVEMHFLADVYVPCDVCRGKRYNRETLEIRFKGKNIQEVLEMTVEDALPFFSAVPTVQPKLQTLLDVGLSYVRLGQSATTLSGGEAQRVKLAKELSKRATGRTLYILDEPTTGLHFADIAQLLTVLHRLRDEGNTILVIEHNLDVIKTADWIVDMGPEGGDGGGRIIAVGTPEQVAAHKSSYTGRYLQAALQRAHPARVAAGRPAQARMSPAWRRLAHRMRGLAPASRAAHLPILRRLDPELRTTGVSPDCSVAAIWPARREHRRVCRYVCIGIEFAHPLGLAAGFDKNGDYLDALGAMGFSHIESGTVTPRPQSGNPKPRMFRVPRAWRWSTAWASTTRAWITSWHGWHGAPIAGVRGISIGKNADTAVETCGEQDYVAACARCTPTPITSR